MVRSGFAQLLSLEPDIHVHSKFSSAKEVFRVLSASHIDVAVIDISIPDESGLVLLEILGAKHPNYKAIILSIFDSAL